MHAMLQMSAQKFALDPRQRRPGGFDLGDDIDAIAVLDDHFGDAANLALDAAHRGDSLLTFCRMHLYPHRVID